ncbi:unnamed protein product [Ranitomeya imitator]|uniref:Uncharacterized protein n=1 Tax=Ranitomeya imitator TaxID=111125 RepID=A0ABN9KPQ0_9NEOB|nr:unnamed protein product [Ranitomeya imitator]
MDHGPPPPHWFNQPPSRPPENMGQWRGMYPPPPPPPHHYRDGGYGYYPPYPVQGSHQAWPAPWRDYYSQYPANIPRHIDYRRPASRAEIYDRSEAYRPLSRVFCTDVQQRARTNPLTTSSRPLTRASLQKMLKTERRRLELSDLDLFRVEPGFAKPDYVQSRVE